ncbi:MAG: antibiotic biosynthesis monooxygenase [Gammaproteobacteria bacterium]|nr:antibiotic biosynthesis monooxygenase [Gammaproteobacteria bacterium]MBU1440242.1 antibiotic biosynthesis monooxygenase [Gammaproteobacteria bacterium]MBU2288519.1 antibiotic biosynthesis monooxygenase [Gammaproteobacteria bacterium]MBU2407756.1 antibiotic biosynthesis monooxygenase [Gammaproteobacteria bacterium]
MECVVLIRRFIKPEREQDFVAWVKAQPPLDRPGFQGKTLTRLDDASQLPPGLNTFHVGANPGAATYIMVERWASIEAFRAYVPNAGTSDQDEYEAAPRQRVILSVV